MHEIIAAVVAQATAIPSKEIDIVLRSPAEHQSNRLYDVWVGARRLVAKEFLKPDEFHAAPTREFRALELLEPLDIAPKPVFFQSKTPALGPVVVYDYLEGEMWDRHRPAATELAQLAQVWLKMNTVATDELWLSRNYGQSLHKVAARFHDALRTYAEWAEAFFEPGRQAAAMCLQSLERCRDVVSELEGCAPVPCFCRSDPRFANVIRRPDGQLGLVDWEDSGLRDPAIDLADLVTHANQEDLLSSGEWQAFLDPYLAARSKVDLHLSHRMHLYLAIFPLFWLSGLTRMGIRLHEEGRLNGWQANGIPAGQRLRRYLARSLAWPDQDFLSQLAQLEGVEFFPKQVRR
jgi:hypothetical protein